MALFTVSGIISSNIDQIRYDGATMILFVAYKTGNCYNYPGVDMETFEALEKSPSKGKFLHQHVIGKCDAIPVDREGHPL